jgi:hypothetical protein
VTTIGPSVHPVRLLGTMGLRNVGTAIAVPVGCFRYADRVSILYVYLARYLVLNIFFTQVTVRILGRGRPCPT